MLWAQVPNKSHSVWQNTLTPSREHDVDTCSLFEAMYFGNELQHKDISIPGQTTWDMAWGDGDKGLPAVSACMGVTCARTLWMDGGGVLASSGPPAQPHTFVSIAYPLIWHWIVSDLLSPSRRHFYLTCYIPYNLCILRVARLICSGISACNLRPLHRVGKTCLG